MRLLLYVIISLITFSYPAASQPAEFSDYISMLELRVSLSQGEERATLMNVPNPQEFKRNYRGPQEPVIPKIEFYELAPPYHLQGLAESLIHGITIGLPPKYDHYGYEIRRYMKSVGNYDIYTNNEAIKEQLNNIAKARIVFKYWRQKLNDDMNSLEERIEKENADSKTRTTFKLNSGIIRAFTIEMQSWLKANEDYLQFLSDRSRYYSMRDGEIGFKNTADRALFLSLYAARERARQQMYKYDPFRIVVY